MTGALIIAEALKELSHIRQLLTPSKES